MTPATCPLQLLHLLAPANAEAGAHGYVCETARTASRYRVTSPGTEAVRPVVPVIVTAYTNPGVAAHSFAMRSGCVTGVTIWISAMP